MKTRLLSLLIVLTMVVSLFSGSMVAYAYEGTCGDGLNWSFDNGVLTISGSGYMHNYDLETEQPWYSHYKDIKEVRIEEGVTSIGKYSFAHCENLAKITIADSVTEIGDFAFLSTALKLIRIPKGVKKVTAGSFRYCYQLENVIVDSSNRYFSSFDGVLFNKDKSVLVYYPGGKKGTSYYIYDDVEEIANLAFYYNPNLYSVTMADSVRIIGQYAFAYCRKLEEVDLSDSLVTMGDYAFYYCERLFGITIPDTLKTVSKAAFLGCSNMRQLKLGRRVETIESSAFSECTMIENVYFPDSVKYIKEYAFAENGIKTLTLGKNVLDIGQYAFGGCKSLTEVIAGPNLRRLNGGFGDCTALTYVNLKDSLQYIGYATFEDCTALTKINLTSPYLEEIASNAFAYWTNLTTVTLSKSIEKISSGAFKKLSSSDPDVEIYYEGTREQWERVEISYPYYLYDAFVSYECDMNRVHTVKFNTNGGEGSYPNREVAENAFMSAPKVPKKDGYIFAGWYANSSFLGEPFITKDGKATRKVTRDITLYAKWEETSGFNWRRNVLQFQNSGYFFEYQYYINDVYYHLLTKDLSKSRKKKITDAINSEFKGSCYGMVAVMMLAQTRDITPSYFQKDADYVGKFSYPKDNKRIASLINYYYLSQNLPQYTDIINPTINPSTKSSAKEIVESLKNIDKTNNPVMINYEYIRTFPVGYKYGHSVMGFEVVDDGSQYVVKIADPNNLVAYDRYDSVTGETLFKEAQPLEMYISYDYSKVEYSPPGVGDLSTADGSMSICSVITYSSFFDEVNLQRKLTGGDDGSSLRAALLVDTEVKTELAVNYTDFEISTEEKSSTVTDGVSTGDLELSEVSVGFDGDEYNFKIIGEDQYTISAVSDDLDYYATKLLYDGECQSYINAYSKEKPVVTVNPFGYVTISSDNACDKEVNFTTESMDFDGIKISANVKTLELEAWDDYTFKVSSDSSLVGTSVAVCNGLHETTLVVESDCTSFVIYYNKEVGDMLTIDTGDDISSNIMTYTVSFVTMGGTDVEGYTGVESGSTICAPNDPEYKGFAFGGWYKDADYTTLWDFDDDVVNEDVYLYAKWDEDPSCYPVVTFNNYGEATQFVVNRGDSISKDMYPKLEEEDGKITLWEDVDLSNIKDDITVNAISVLKEEAVQIDTVSANYAPDTLTMNISFGLCVVDCTMVVDILDENEENIIQTNTYALCANEKQKTLSIPYTADDQYYIVSISFVDNDVDKNLCGISGETYFYAERPIYEDGVYKYKLNKDTAIICGYTGYDKYLTIPDSIGGHKVEEIGDYAFYGMQLEEVILPSGLKCIGEGAFYNNNFDTIRIPASVEHIEEMAFLYCQNLNNIETEAGNKSFCVSDGVLFNADKTKLILYPIGKSGADYIIPDMVEEIYGGAFCNTAIESISIPKSVRLIGKNAFGECYNLKTVYYAGSKDEYDYEIDVDIGNYMLNYAELICSGAALPVYVSYLYATYEDSILGVSVNFSTVEEDGLLIVGVYDGNKLIATETIEHTVSDGTYRYIEMDMDKDCIGYKTKVYYWAGKTSLRPISNVKETLVDEIDW